MDASATSGTLAGSPGKSADPEPADADVGRFDSGPWLVVGGGMAAVGAGVLVVQWVGLRRRRPVP